MNSKDRERYEYLKKLNKEKNKEKKWQENILFMDCIRCIEKKEIVSEVECKEVLDCLWNTFPVSEAGHIMWSKANCIKRVVGYNQLKDYIDISKFYYIIWDNYELPIIKCSLRSIINNVDDVEAVSFSYLIISEDFKIVLESEKYGYVNMGFFN